MGGTEQPRKQKPQTNHEEKEATQSPSSLTVLEIPYEVSFQKSKRGRDQHSHRLIEKRRRDRMNNCLAILSRHIPSRYLEKGRGKVEKTEIIEMATKYLQHLQGRKPSEVTTKPEDASTRDLKFFQMGFQESVSKICEFLRTSEEDFQNFEDRTVFPAHHSLDSAEDISCESVSASCPGSSSGDDYANTLHTMKNRFASASEVCFPNKRRKNYEQNDHQEVFEEIKQRNGIKLKQPDSPTGYPSRDKMIPAFVLHTSGTFYIPFTVDYSVVASEMTNYEESDPVLHPVSIYVKCGSSKANH